jgi:hypothetical protein
LHLQQPQSQPQLLQEMRLQLLQLLQGLRLQQLQGLRLQLLQGLRQRWAQRQETAAATSQPRVVAMQTLVEVQANAQQAAVPSHSTPLQLHEADSLRLSTSV